MTSTQRIKVLIGGGSGFIGTALTARLKQKGHEVLWISRTAGNGKITWKDVANENNELPEIDVAVNLAGTNLMSKLLWTDETKKEVLDSRVKTTSTLAKAIANNRFRNGAPSTFILGSAVGYYPMGIPGPTVDEDTLVKPDTFFSRLVAHWEQSIESEGLNKNEVRLVKIRTGMVLGHEGGALPSMLPLFKMGIINVAGSGKQIYPWIHIDDIVGIFEHAIINNDISGILNGVAPNPVSALDLAKTMNKSLGGKQRDPIHVPEFVLKMMLGPDRAPLILEGQNVIPKRTLASGYEFQYPDIAMAMNNLLSSK